MKGRCSFVVKTANLHRKLSIVGRIRCSVMRMPRIMPFSDDFLICQYIFRLTDKVIIETLIREWFKSYFSMRHIFIRFVLGLRIKITNWYWCIIEQNGLWIQPRFIFLNNYDYFCFETLHCGCIFSLEIVSKWENNYCWRFLGKRVHFPVQFRMATVFFINHF